MRAEITKTFRFEAAHRLPNHRGKCSQPHGHGYRVDVALYGEVRPADGTSEEGMVMDFADVSAAWKVLEPRLDHRDLNEALAGDVDVTTAECIAHWLFGRFTEMLGDEVTSVTVWETETCRATVRR
jgi:6-pyruvoyltetrahydropterin/6-carboxytetrahydropterin synthase